MISSCTEEINNTLDTKKENNTYDLSIKDAISIAKSFQESVTSNNKTRTDGVSFEIKTSYRLDNSKTTRACPNDITPLVYEIDMNDGLKNGRMIISGDKRFPEVLAYMPSFNDSLFKVSIGPNVMVQMAKNTLLNKIQKYKENRLTRSHPVDNIPGEVSVMIVPFCNTEWSESSPLNNFLPSAWIQIGEGVGNRPGSALYMNYYTGEAVVAIAQAMAYTQPNININGIHIDWKALTQETEITQPYSNMAATLAKYIYESLGTYPVWGKAYSDRWPQSSETIVDAVIAMETPIYKIPNAINSSQCGIYLEKDQNWNLDIVKKSILNLNPVFVGDYSRLAFLVDGYAVKEDNSMYLHCRFCKKQFDGYFLVYDDGRVVFDLNGYTYRDVNLGIIANIRNR